MAIKYKDVGYASERLSGSIVRHEGIPVYVDGINEDGEAAIRKLASDKGFYYVPYDELDLTPVPLGNINVNGSVMFAKRMPKRRDWRQGLRENNLHSEVVHGDEQRVRATCTDLLNTILGIFPSIKTCIESVECREAEGMAFSRQFSVGRKEAEGYSLTYRVNNRIGWASIAPDGNINTKLRPEFEYLKEYLQESLK